MCRRTRPPPGILKGPLHYLCLSNWLCNNRVSDCSTGNAGDYTILWKHQVDGLGLFSREDYISQHACRTTCPSMPYVKIDTNIRHTQKNGLLYLDRPLQTLQAIACSTQSVPSISERYNLIIRSIYWIHPTWYTNWSERLLKAGHTLCNLYNLCTLFLRPHSHHMHSGALFSASKTHWK